MTLFTKRFSLILCIKHKQKPIVSSWWTNKPPKYILNIGATGMFNCARTHGRLIPIANEAKFVSLDIVFHKFLNFLKLRANDLIDSPDLIQVAPTD